MRLLCLQLVTICVLLQVPGCFPSCLIRGSVANCAAQRLTSVPALPPGITHLYLAMNRIGEMNSSSLSGLEQLQELDLGKQSVISLVIRNDTFVKQRRLKKLMLDFNVGLQLEPGAFEGLSSLQWLHLGYCSLGESILKENFLEPLSSLETLNLFGNRIKRLQPAMFFANMSHLKDLDLQLNRISNICESDLVAFRGKRFNVVNLKSVLNRNGFDCGNPFRGMSFQTLDLSNHGFSLDGLKRFFRAIDGTKISQLKLSGHIGKGLSFNNLPDPDRTTFEGLANSSVLELDLSKNRIFALQQEVFSPLREVVHVDVSQNRVNQIHRNAFRGLQGHLNQLNLSHNLLGEVYAHTFASLTNLEVLDLSYNHIGALGFGSFRGLPRLKTLLLTGNALRDIGFPESLPSLDRLSLNDNRLASLAASGVSRFAGNVKHLDVRDNRLKDLGDVYALVSRLKRLQSLSFGGNTIRWCTQGPPIGPNDLQLLDLRGSSLQTIWSQGKCLNLFDGFGRAEVVNLSFNGLRSLPGGVFKGLASVRSMDLSSNALTYLRPGELPKSLKALYLADNFIASPDPAAFRSLSILDLTMNRFHCDADLKNFVTWMIRTNVTFLSPVEELRCEFPAGFRNTPLLQYSAQVTLQENHTSQVLL